MKHLLAWAIAVAVCGVLVPEVWVKAPKGTPYPAGILAAAEAWPAGVGSLEDNRCTVFAVRPLLLVTASHCVYRPGATNEVAFWRGILRVPHEAVVVWDGGFVDPAVDLAFLVPERPWSPMILSGPLPVSGETLTAATMTLGIERWQTPVQYFGLVHQERYGWVLAGQGLLGRGSSGGPWLLRGRVVGLHVAGTDGPPRLSLAIPVGTVRQALRALDRDGLMPAP